VEDVTDAGGTVTVFWAINDSLTGRLTRLGARDDIGLMLQAVQATGIDYESIDVIGSFDPVDACGRAE
jgi:hypothetical protein